MAEDKKLFYPKIEPEDIQQIHPDGGGIVMTKGFKAVKQGFIFREPIINGIYTKKGNGVRQGGGKGGRCGNYVRLRKGQVIFEIDKSDIKTITTNLKKASSKMPIKVCIVKRRYCF